MLHLTDKNNNYKQMKLTFLGTGTSQGVPMIGCTEQVCRSNNPKDKRLRSSVLLEWDKFTYVIDCGPDFRQQMLTAQVTHIDGVLFTHEHADHTAGLDDIRVYSNNRGFVPIYAFQRVMDNLKTRFFYIFQRENRYLGAPKVEENIITTQDFQLQNIWVSPISVVHGKLDIFGYKIEKLAYITDASFISKVEKEKLKNLDVLVINALRIKPHPTHFNLQQSLDFISEINPKAAYLTHISHKLGSHLKVSKQLPDNVFLAYDGLEVTL
jgi:phosphoribosyl 1,2-cyclic phosphate phosphodiesterase